MMKTLASGYKSSMAAPNSQYSRLEAMRQANRANENQGKPQSAVQGVPGEYDFRKFLTPALQEMVPVHYHSGGSVVSSLAVATGSKEWRDLEYDPGRYSGLFSPAGEYASGNLTFTLQIQDLEHGGYKDVEVANLPQAEVLPTKSVQIQKSSAKPFSINVLQSTDPA
jgi:hypothetical protein